MANENIIDFGEWTVPSGWNELTLGMFSKIERFYSDKDKPFNAVDVLEAFTDHSKDEIDQLPIEFVEKLLEALKWLSEPPKYGEPTNKIEINGEKYSINFQEHLRTGEYVAADTLMKSDRYNYAALLAILCRKDGEAYDSRFEAEVLSDRIKMFEGISMMKVMPLVFFFINLWLASENLTQLYSTVEEALDLSAQSIENSRKSGDLSALSYHLLKRRLKKLRKSMPRI